jgi:hypothetical protein
MAAYALQGDFGSNPKETGGMGRNSSLPSSSRRPVCCSSDASIGTHATRSRMRTSR